MTYNYEYFRKSVDYVLSKLDFVPEIAVIMGSCLGNIADEIIDPIVIDYKDIPNFLISTVDNHAGQLVIGQLCGKKVVCMSGRFHYYEGYDFEQLVIPIRLFKTMGVKKTIITNAAGAINTSYKPGDIMIINDHIKFMGASPLRGENIKEFGPRFFDVGDMYDKDLIEIAFTVASQTELDVYEGVYYFSSGPQFETHAEIRAMRLLGADAVGMSTVTEALTAAHCGMPLLALSMVTNMAAGILDQPVTPEEVDATAQVSTIEFVKYLKAILKAI